MSSDGQVRQLQDHVESGYEIVDVNHLHGLRKKVYKSNDEGFRKEDNNFGSYVRYSLNEESYNKWLNEVEETLRNNGLQVAKFRFKISDYNPDKESGLPAQKFIRALRELEEITTNPEYRNTYISNKELAPITYRNGVLKQGSFEHHFSIEYKRFIAFMWQFREVRNSSDIITKSAKPQTYAMIEAETGIRPSRFASIATTLRKLESDKSIYIQFRYLKTDKLARLVVKED